MNYEEKYKEMKKRVLAIGQGYVKEVDYSSPRSIAEYIDPDLKESEDERIVKELISFLKEEEAKADITSKRSKTLCKYIVWLEKQSTSQVRTGPEWVTMIDDACDKRYSEEYAHGEYCHEQSFKWGFQEGVDWLEKQGDKVDVLDDFPTEFERQISHLIASSINKEWEYKKDFVKHTANALLQYAKNELEKQGENELEKYINDERNKKDFYCEGKEMSWNEMSLDVRKHDYPYYFKGNLDCYPFNVEKQGEQKPIEQDTEIRDLWVYIREWNDKFGRLPKDEDELAACIDYVLKRQKPADKVEPKFKIGDTIVEKDFDECGYETIKDIKDGQYIFTDGSGMNINEQNGWQLVKTSTNIKQNPAWSEEDEQNLNFWLDNNKSIDSDKRNWLKSIKERVQPQPKQEWSEEDEEKRKLLISILEVNHPNGCFKVNPINTSNMEVMSTKELVNWLKSPKPNYWKPSEEQMKALNAINIFGELSYVGQGGTLVKLYNDLEKL